MSPPAAWTREALTELRSLVDAEPTVRDARLAELARRDAGLAAAVRELLAADAAEGGLLDRAPSLFAAVAGDSPAGDEPRVRLGDVFGPWRTTALLGRGGMGEVYAAERVDGQYEQRAALKLLRLGMGSEEILARFLRERQILARLEHPNIARLLDGGLAADGRPYFVLELVTGQPITDWCEERRLGLEERLRLMITCCEAVEAAHRSLVVHRDLKPSNILVSEAGEVKLLDFGIAKLLGADEEAGDLTRADVRILTPAYAAPEQILGGPVTTATDVFGLGVVLYELLTGALPHDRRSTSGAELASLVERETVTRPSTALAKGRRHPGAGHESRRLPRSLAGDLDTIVLEALHRDPARRYSSAAALGEDLRRLLAGRPVLARPDSRGYRARKFLGRHRLGVLAATLVALSLAGGLLAALYQGSVARAERDRARIEAATAERTAAFLADAFSIASPVRAKGATITARDVLDRGAERIDAELAGEPEVRARLLDTLGHVYVHLGVFPQAETLFRQALEIQRERHGRHSLEEARALYGLGAALTGAGELREARRVLELSLVIQTTHGGPEDRLLSQTLSSLGALYVHAGDFERAGETLRRALAVHDRLQPDDRTTRGNLSNSLGIVAWQIGELDEAVDLLADALAIGEASGEDVLTSRALANLSQVLRVQGRLAEAIPLKERQLALAEKLYGAESLPTAQALEGHASLYNDLDDFARAEPLYLRSIAIYERNGASEHPHLAFALKNYGNLLKSAGDYQGARTLYRRALEIREKALGPDNSDVALSLMSLGEIEGLLGRREAAETLLRRALGAADRSVGPDHLRRAEVLSALGAFLAAQGCGVEARDAFGEALRIRRARLPAGHEKIAQSERALAECGVLDPVAGSPQPADPSRQGAPPAP